MASQIIWYNTDIPPEIIDIIERDLENNFNNKMQESLLGDGVKDFNTRTSENAWIPSEHWISGFIWHFVQKANRENFLYDLSHIDAECLQYTKYSEGSFYSWHSDDGLYSTKQPLTGDYKKDSSHNFIQENSECMRKLSFVLQLSDPDDYEGGNLQFIDFNSRKYFATRRRGALIVFDSRTPHRVLKVTKGTRRSLVGWAVGARWK